MKLSKKICQKYGNLQNSQIIWPASNGKWPRRCFNALLTYVTAFPEHFRSTKALEWIAHFLLVPKTNPDCEWCILIRMWQMIQQSYSFANPESPLAWIDTSEMALFTSKEFDDPKSLFDDFSLQKLTQNQLQDGQIQKNSIF